MSVRPPDFKSSGVRVERIIASGSNKNPRLLIIGSGSTNSDGVTVNTDTLKLSGTGSDTWIFISGSTGTGDLITLGGNTFLSGSLFGGNLAITGTQLSVQTRLPHGGLDVNFFVDGIAGSKDTSVRGTSVFTGDMVVSGVIRDGSGVAYYPGTSTGPDGAIGDLQFNDGSGGFGASATLNFDVGTDTLSLTKLIASDALSGSLTKLADGSSYLIEGSNITILSNSNGSITISSTGGGGGTSNWSELSPSPRLNTTASVAIAGNLGSSYAAESKGSDVFFFVSGTKGGTVSSNKKSVFGGDLTVSGVLNVGSAISGSDLDIFFGTMGSLADTIRIRHPSQTLSQSTAIFYSYDSAYSLELSGGLVVNGQNTHGYGDLQVYGSGSQTTIRSDSGTGRLFLSGTQVTVNRMSPHGGTDVNFFVSGTRGSMGTSIRGTSVFSGDLIVSGTTFLGAGVGDKLSIGSLLASDIIPDSDRIRNLGSVSSRFANIYTGDLHLKNERGDWTVIEEHEFLTITNNKTGKRFKILMEPID